MNRRSFMKYAALGSACNLPGLLGACTTQANRKAPFVFVHGAWSNAHQFAKVIPFLVESGHLVAAEDLPGHGLNAKFPRSYFQRPLDREAFSSEPSPLRNITLQDYVSSIVRTIEALDAQGNGPVILVGYSSGGIAATAVGEAIPEKIKRLIYISGIVPTMGHSADEYLQFPEAKDAKGRLLLVPGDVSKIGALRMDPRSENESFRRLIKKICCDDVSQEEFESILNLQTPDTPLNPFTARLDLSQNRWGRIKRTYIRCSQDRVFPPALQQLFIYNADTFSPQNKTELASLNTSHSPMVSDAKGLAETLLRFA